MHITLYIANDNEHIKYFTGHISNLTVSECYLGCRIESDCNQAELPFVSTIISHYIIEFYLKEAILTKIYDEYVDFNINDAVKLLTNIFENVCNTAVYKKIFEIMKNGGQLCIDSFIIFNIKSIMQNIYEIVDIMAENIISEKEYNSFVGMLRVYTTLNTGKCRDAVVEFSQEDMCKVDFDSLRVENLNSDNLLSVLTEYSPERITLKNSCNSPELTRLLREIFEERICEK